MAGRVLSEGTSSGENRGTFNWSSDRKQGFAFWYCAVRCLEKTSPNPLIQQGIDSLKKSPFYVTIFYLLKDFFGV